MVILADDEMLRRALAEMGAWCEEWSVKVNVDKCGIMHRRKIGVKRLGQRIVISGELVQNVAV